MKQLINERICDLAINNYSFIQLFQDYKIDFFCKGSQTLKEALKNGEVEEERFVKSMNEIQSKGVRDYSVRIEDWPLDLLADYIQKTHHRFTDRVLVEIKSAVNNCLEGKYKDNKVLTAFKIPLELLAKELGGHMKKEEFILFPYIRKMVSTRGKLEEPRFKSVENPIDMMIHEHDTAFELLKEIRVIFNNYIVNESSPEEIKSIVLLMSDLDHDLTLHLHLENNILFPKVVEFEKNRLFL